MCDKKKKNTPFNAHHIMIRILRTMPSVFDAYGLHGTHVTLQQGDKCLKFNKPEQETLDQ